MDQSGRVEIPGTTSRCWSFPLQHEVGDCGSRMGTVWTRHALSSVYFRKTRHGWGERGNELMTKFFFQKEKEGWKFLRIFSNIFFLFEWLDWNVKKSPFIHGKGWVWMKEMKMNLWWQNQPIGNSRGGMEEDDWRRSPVEIRAGD